MLFLTGWDFSVILRKKTTKICEDPLSQDLVQAKQRAVERRSTVSWYGRCVRRFTTALQHTFYIHIVIDREENTAKAAYLISATQTKQSLNKFGEEKHLVPNDLRL